MDGTSLEYFPYFRKLEEFLRFWSRGQWVIPDTCFNKNRNHQVWYLDYSAVRSFPCERGWTLHYPACTLRGSVTRVGAWKDRILAYVISDMKCDMLFNTPSRDCSVLVKKKVVFIDKRDCRFVLQFNVIKWKTYSSKFFLEFGGHLHYNKCISFHFNLLEILQIYSRDNQYRSSGASKRGSGALNPRKFRYVCLMCSDFFWKTHLHPQLLTLIAEGRGEHYRLFGVDSGSSPHPQQMLAALLSFNGKSHLQWEQIAV